MSKAKQLRRSRASERGEMQRLNIAVMAERARCSGLCELYARQAEERGMITHPLVARQIAEAIREAPTS